MTNRKSWLNPDTTVFQRSSFFYQAQRINEVVMTSLFSKFCKAPGDERAITENVQARHTILRWFALI